MAYTDEELREMLLKANIELSRLTEKMLSMKAPAELIHKILSVNKKTVFCLKPITKPVFTQWL